MPHLFAAFLLRQSVSAFLQASSRFAQSCVPHTPVFAQEADLLHAAVVQGDDFAACLTAPHDGALVFAQSVAALTSDVGAVVDFTVLALFPVAAPVVLHVVLGLAALTVAVGHIPFTMSASVLPDWQLPADAFCCAAAQLPASLPRALFISFSTLLATGATQLAALTVTDAAAEGLTISVRVSASGIAVIKSFFIKFRMFVTSLLLL